jgi:hypothetical protein
VENLSRTIFHFRYLTKTTPAIIFTAIKEIDALREAQELLQKPLRHGPGTDEEQLRQKQLLESIIKCHTSIVILDAEVKKWNADRKGIRWKGSREKKVQKLVNELQLHRSTLNTILAVSLKDTPPLSDSNMSVEEIGSKHTGPDRDIVLAKEPGLELVEQRKERQRQNDDVQETVLKQKDSSFFSTRLTTHLFWLICKAQEVISFLECPEYAVTSVFIEVKALRGILVQLLELEHINTIASCVEYQDSPKFIKQILATITKCSYTLLELESYLHDNTSVSQQDRIWERAEWIQIRDGMERTAKDLKMHQQSLILILNICTW